MNFERGKSPAESMGIGKFQKIKRGAYFYVRFRDRFSRPEFYALQENEKKGIPAEAVALDGERINFAGRRVVHCRINTIPHETFTAGWHRKEKCWVIGPVDDAGKYTDDTGPR